MKRLIIFTFALLLLWTAVASAVGAGARPVAHWPEDGDTLTQAQRDSIVADSVMRDSLRRAYEVQRIIERAREDSIHQERRRQAAEQMGVSLDAVSEKMSKYSWLYDPLDDRNNRYIPEDDKDPYHKASILRHLFVGVYSGVDGFLHARKHHYDATTPVGAYVGYQFDRISGVRLGANFALYKNSDTKVMMRHTAIELDYVLGLTRYMYGYSESRLFDISPIVGLGLDYSKYDHTDLRSTASRKAKAFKAKVGVNLALNLSSQSMLYAEPYIAIAQDQIDLSGFDNPMPYDMQWGVRAGLRVDMQAFSKMRFVDPYYNKNVFIDFSAGGNMYIGPYLNAKRSLGSDWRVAVGKWLDPIVGVRGGIGANDFYWLGESQFAQSVGTTQVSTGRNRFHRGFSMYGMAELMLRPFNLLGGWREREKFRWFDFDVAAGLTLGGYAKSHVPGYGDISRMYWGWTFSAEALFAVAPGFTLFVQPRFNLNNFYVPNAFASKFGRSYDGLFTDKLFTLAGGVRIQRPTASDSVDNIRLRRSSEFKRWGVSVQVGSHKVMTASKLQSEYPMNLNVAVRGVYRLLPCLGVGAEVEYVAHNEQMELPYTVESNGVPFHYRGFSTLTHNMMSFKILGQVDIARWWNGERASHHWVLTGHAGPTFNLDMHSIVKLNDREVVGGDTEPVFAYRDLKGTKRFGLFGGFRLGYRFNPGITLYINPEGHVIASRIMLSEQNVFRQKLPTVITKVAAGLEYEF